MAGLEWKGRGQEAVSGGGGGGGGERESTHQEGTRNTRSEKASPENSEATLPGAEGKRRSPHQRGCVVSSVNRGCLPKAFSGTGINSRLLHMCPLGLLIKAGRRLPPFPQSWPFGQAAHGGGAEAQTPAPALLLAPPHCACYSFICCWELKEYLGVSG